MRSTAPTPRRPAGKPARRPAGDASPLAGLLTGRREARRARGACKISTRPACKEACIPCRSPCKLPCKPPGGWGCRRHQDLSSAVPCTALLRPWCGRQPQPPGGLQGSLQGDLQGMQASLQAGPAEILQPPCGPPCRSQGGPQRDPLPPCRFPCKGGLHRFQQGPLARRLASPASLLAGFPASLLGVGVGAVDSTRTSAGGLLAGFPYSKLPCKLFCMPQRYCTAEVLVPSTAPTPRRPAGKPARRLAGEASLLASGPC